MDDKKLSLHNAHLKFGGKMVSFAGYQMPIQYKGVKQEHLCVRNSVGVFDVSHMGEFLIKGKGAFDLVQKVISNDIELLYDGKVQYAYMPNLKGGIVDDLLVYRIEQDVYMLVVNAANIKKDLEWITNNNTNNTEVIDISEKTSLLAIQGPYAQEVLQYLTSVKLNDMSYYTFQKGEFAGVDNVLISKTGYTGAGGFEIYFDNFNAEIIWNEIMITGKKFDIQPIGLAARDTLRLEMGFCLYGNEITEDTCPIEAGLGWVTKFNTRFINYELLMQRKQNGINRKLVGFKMLEKGIARKDYLIKDSVGNPIGIVTSGTMSPSLNLPIGMGYVQTKYLKKNKNIFIEIRNKLIGAKVVKTPFINK